MDQKKILIVDDDADLVLANRLVLESAGYAVDEAANGAECLEKLRASLPNLVLMDVMMANPLDGYLTTQQIFDDESLREALAERGLSLDVQGAIGDIVSDIEAESEALVQELKTHRRNLRTLRQQAAIYGAGAVPLHLLNHIEHEEEAVRDIERRLGK